LNAILHQPEQVMAALEQLHNAPAGTLDAYENAALILNGTQKFRFVGLLFWSEVLSSVDWIQKFLQSKETTFYQALNQLGTLT
jgi:hypothetical protein